MLSGKCATAAACLLIWGCGSTAFADPTRYSGSELAPETTREYLQLNNRLDALTMRQDSPHAAPLNIVIETWKIGAYSEIRPSASPFANRIRALAFNDSRHIAGYGESVSANGKLYEQDGSPTVQRRAFVWSNGVFTDLSQLPPLTRGSVATDGWGSEGTAINDNGEVAGIWTDANGTHGFFYSQGTMVEIGSLGTGPTIDTRPTAINGLGHIVGVSGDTASGTGPHAFLYANGDLRDLGVVGVHTFSAATDINDSGQVVGKLGGHPKGSGCFLYENGTMRELGTLGGSQCFTAKINNSGVIGGSTTLAGQDDPVAYVHIDGRMLDLNTLVNWSSLQLSQRWTLTDVLSINDDGILLVAATSASGQIGHFLIGWHGKWQPTSVMQLASGTF